MAAAFVEVLKYISSATKRATIRKAENEDELEKARSGIYKNNAENIKKQRVGQEYGNKKQDEFVKTVLTNLKQRLQRQKLYYDRKPTKSKSDMMRDKFLELLQDKKIKFDGKVERFKKDTKRNGAITFQSCIRTVDIRPEIEGQVLESEWWDTVIRPIFQEEIVREQAKRQKLFISSDELSKWEVKNLKGTEAVVYEDPKDATKVLKVTNLSQQDEPTITEFCERNIGFNAMFDATRYDLIGFAEKSNGSIQPVTRQAYIAGYELRNLPSEEYDKFAKQYRNDGYEVEEIMPGHVVLRYGGYEASDLHDSNIIKREDDGRYYVIDAFVSKLPIKK